MISKEMEKAFNDQINAELYSEYLYLSMQAYFSRLNLQGFVNWFTVQVQEEHAHAMGMFDYVHERGGDVRLMAIDAPQTDWESPLACFEHVLEHEQLVTSKINALMDVAENERDRAALSFLDWYATLKLIKDDANALLLLDKDLAARTFVQPVIG